MLRLRRAAALLLMLGFGLAAVATETLAAPHRARDLGVPFVGTPGPLNALTDVAGIEVGHTTLIRGEGKLVVGQGPVRTGVTVIFPRGKTFTGRVFAARHNLNGNGEMTGASWLDESGCLGSPILLTNTHSVGVVRDAVIAWSLKHADPKNYSGDLSLPVVTETYDGFLNDINGFHVKPEHVVAALDGARGGPVPEGNVGGGTGMIAHGFKGGIGTASRVVKINDTPFTVGVLVQANYGRRDNLAIAGVPLGPVFPDLTPTRGAPKDGQGSIVIIVATDTPLLPHQLRRLAQRASLGVGLIGGRGENSSGDLFLAFSIADAAAVSQLEGVATVRTLPNEQINPLFNATVQATEEAIVNALVAAETMTGADGNTVYALPHDRLRDALRKHGRLVE